VHKLAIKFSLAISGNENLMHHFVKAVKLKYPRVIIYDRNEEARRPPSPLPIPPHPKVADVDAVFILSGSKEAINIRSPRGHRFFSYHADLKKIDPVPLALLLDSLVLALEELAGLKNNIEKPVTELDPST
jgi:hypothetical protein